MLAHSAPRIQSRNEQAGDGPEATFPSDNTCLRRSVLPAGHIGDLERFGSRASAGIGVRPLSPNVAFYVRRKGSDPGNGSADLFQV